MLLRRVLVCVALSTACDGADKASTPSAPAAPEPAPAVPTSTPLPDCAGVDPTPPVYGKPEDWLAKARREPEDPKLVAKVGDQTVPRTDFDAILALKIEKYVSRKREPPQSALDRYRASIAGRLVGHEMLRQEAAARGIADDAAAIDRRANDARDGIADYALHLQRRGETEASLRAMYTAELREVAIIEADAPIAIEDAQLVGYYCRNRDDWRNDREYRVVSRLSFQKRADAEGAIANLGAGTRIDAMAASTTAPFDRSELVASSDNAYFKSVFAAPQSVPTLVEVGSTFYVVIVEQIIPVGGLSRELVFDALQEPVRQGEITKRRVTLRAQLLAKYPVVVFGIPEAPEPADADDDGP
jgi:hypothetical protein